MKLVLIANLYCSIKLKHKCIGNQLSIEHMDCQYL